MNTGQYTLKAETRSTDTKPSHLRDQGLVPAVLYGHHQEPQAVSLNALDFSHLYHRAGESSLVSLQLGEDTKPVLIKEPQFHPVTGAVTHVDLYAVNMREKIKADIPLAFEGEAPAVASGEAILVTNKDHLEVECLPADLPHDIKVDISGLANIEDQILVKDISVPAGVEVLDEPEEIVVIINAQREETEEPVVSEAEAVAAVEASAEKTEEASE